MSFTPSVYQENIFNALNTSQSNLVIEAVAGSGKSTTLVQSIKRIDPSKSILFLAFNKSIVNELKTKVKDHRNVEVSTLHSIGYQMIKSATPCEIDSYKYDKLFQRYASNIGIDIDALRAADVSISAYKSNILKIADLIRMNLISTREELTDLVERYGIEEYLDESRIARTLVHEAIKMDLEKMQNFEMISVDFTDMIFMPTIKPFASISNNSKYKFDFVFIDECQDLNKCQQQLFQKCIAEGGRFVAVGDPFQAIYGFAGADVNSFNALKLKENTKTFPLSVCYRCDSNIIDLAKKIVPHIQARDTAGEGAVNVEDKIENIKSGDLVISRLNAPLVSLALHFLSKGVKATILGRDFANSLIKMIDGKTASTQGEFRRVLDGIRKSHIEREYAKLKIQPETYAESQPAKMLEDKINALWYLFEGCRNVNELANKIKNLFKDSESEGIVLATIHKSKGLESERVFILNPDDLYFGPAMRLEWSAEQEKNLVYVAYTRAKHYLGFVKYN